MPKFPPKAATNKVGNYGLVTKFPGYHAREDYTMLPQGTLIPPSQNVLISTAGRVSHVRGYVLDGAASATADSGILSNFDFNTFKGDVRNMRAGFLTTSPGSDGKLQYRYVTGTSPVNWVDLKTALTNVRLSFCEYWDNVALVKKILWVDGTNNVFSWNGAVTTVASATAATVTKQDATKTWEQEGFTQTGIRSIVIGGVSATYTGGEGTTTLTGVSVDFSATAVGAIAHQAVVTNTLASMTSILATFGPTLIGCGRSNQVYLGTSNSNNLYISKVNDFTNYAFTSPNRLVGEGNRVPLDAPPVCFIPMESRQSQNAYDLYISQGKDRWGVIRATLSADLTAEKLEHIRLKTTSLQAAQSSKLTGRTKNHIIYVGNDNVANFFGYLSFEEVPVLTDFSWPILDDMTSYDFTDGSIFYHRNYIFVAIPKSGIVRVFNMTDQTQQQNTSLRGIEDVTQQPWFWETPITYPISGFYVVNGVLYGHSYTTSESYNLFSGGSLNGQQIDVNATFSYDDKGDRTQSKASDEMWIEGYIKQNTTLSATVSGDLDSLAVLQTVTVNGNDNTIVGYGSGGHAFGSTPLGSAPIGGANTSTNTRPAWFHVAKTYPNVPCYLESVSFSTKGVDLDWQLLAYGTNAQFTPEGNNEITQ